jgi:NAD(P)H-dependent nitrite reductase small subunit
MPLRETLDSLGTPAVAETQTAPSEADADTWVRAVDTDDLPNGESLLVYVGGEQVALFHAGGQFYATANRCPHANASLAEGSVMLAGDGRPAVLCPGHDSQFDLRTGEPLCGPAARILKTYAVKVEDGCVYIRAGAPGGVAA